MSTIGQTGQSRTASRSIASGVIAGVVAGTVMAMYAMLASATFLHQGFFTPLYGIASPIVGQAAMMTSFKEGVYFALGPALLGLVVHMLWSAMYGVVFGLIARAARLRGVLAVIAGVVYGLVIELMMGMIVLPILGLASMPGTIGLPSFTVEHLLFGLTLGLWVAARPQDIAPGARPNSQPLGYTQRSEQVPPALPSGGAHERETFMAAQEPQVEAGIVMYTTLWCGDCRRAKRVFAAVGVPYAEVNIEHDPRAGERVRRLNGGMQSVPSIHFPDGSWLVEPSNAALEAKLWPYAAASR